MSESLTPKQAMAMAIDEAKRGAGFVSPNPLVGCVIVDADGRFLSSGYHARVGGDHAEVVAVKQVSDLKRLEGAVVYVTLEPCAHFGRTPPCASMLAGLPISTVVYGLEDPNPQVAGRGAEMLRAAGKKVELYQDLRTELEELAEIFLVNMRLKRPFVALKTAASLDGKIGLKDGTSQWLTGEHARDYSSGLRGHYDAVLTGIGTVLKDNPRMNSRAARFAAKVQRLVILDPEGTCLARLGDLNVAKVRGAEELFVVVGRGKQRDCAARVIEADLVDGEFDLRQVLDRLRAEGIHSIFVEAGGFTTGRFLRSGLVDRLYLFLAPKILGEGMAWSPGFEARTLDEGLRLEHVKCEKLAEDLLLTGRLVRSDL